MVDRSNVKSLAVFISNSPSPAPWSQNGPLSIDSQGATIHLPTNANEQLRTIKQAGRMLSMLTQNASLQGTWNVEQSFAFCTSFNDAQQRYSVEITKAETSLENALKAHAFTVELVNDTPQNVSPEALAERAASWLKNLAPESINYRTVVGEELQEAGWNGIYEVGRGSDRPPVLLDLDYNPTGNPDAPVNCVLVGKGITFDSGGYSIKSSEGMLAMKCDMGGAATVTGALGLAIMNGLTQRTRLILCCAENLISGHAYKLGDIITYKNGLTVEVVNTDAEGRLVLADGLLLASEYTPKRIIDAATLTGAAHVAVGNHYNALFSRDKALLELALQTAEQVNEPAWPLPLEAFHQQNCPSPYADTANSRPQKGGGAGGASNAAGFLSRFVPEEGQGWLHVDLAAAFNSSATDTQPAGATAQGIRMLANLLN